MKDVDDARSLDSMESLNVLEQERDVDVEDVDLEFALALADVVHEMAPKPVVLRIESPVQCVFHGAQTGTNRFNDVAVVRKIETVMALGHATLWWNMVLAERGTRMSEHPLVDQGRFTDIAGGFPLRHGQLLIGAAAVSGLDPLEDHALLVAGLQAVQSG